MVLALGLFLSSTAHAACPDRWELLDAFEASVLEADFAGAEEKLEEVEEAFACGPVADRERELGRFWLIEGALLSLQGDSTSAADSFRGAARVAPGVWIEDLGGGLRATFEQVSKETMGRAELSVQPPLRVYRVWVDGKEAEVPLQVDAGMHLIQIGPNANDMRYATIALVFEGEPAVVAHELEEPTIETAPEPTVAPVEKAEFVATIRPYAGVGGQFGYGKEQSNSQGSEGAAKIAVPLETGLRVGLGAAWIRPAIVAGPSLGGLVYTDDQGLGEGYTPTFFGLDATIGASVDEGDVGLLVGTHWPGRTAVRATFGGKLGDAGLFAEGRLGVDAGVGGVEPVVQAVLAFQPEWLVFD